MPILPYLRTSERHCLPHNLYGCCFVFTVHLHFTGIAVQAASSNDPAMNDLNVLNFALTLEQLELAFYTEALATIPCPNSPHANDLSTQWSTLDASLNLADGSSCDYMYVILQHEQAHVDFLTTALKSTTVTPVPSCNPSTYTYTGYKFGAGFTDSVAHIVATAQALENTGVMAYDGAINNLDNTAYQQAAATIATIEARHASFLNMLNKASGFPAVTDTPKSPSDIVAIASPFFDPNGPQYKSCTASLSNLPFIRPTGVASANGQTPGMASSPFPTSPAPTYSTAQATQDLATLNYALTLEHLEAAFYNAFMTKYSQQDFANAKLSDSFTIFTRFQMIQSHENAHVTILQGVISGRGGTPVQASTYCFDKFISSVQTGISTAQLLENTGVSAYDGAVNTITDTGLQQAAATIATVEARHASFLNAIELQPNADAQFPNGSFDKALTMAQVLSAVQATGIICSEGASAGTGSGNTSGSGSGSGSNGSGTPSTDNGTGTGTGTVSSGSTSTGSAASGGNGNGGGDISTSNSVPSSRAGVFVLVMLGLLTLSVRRWL
jgi:rubrerythrin